MSRKQARNPQPAKPAGMRKLEHRGYAIIQSPRNHHVMIGKDRKMVYHAHCDRPLTDEELRKQVDDYIIIAGITDNVAASLQKPTGGVAYAGPAPKSRKPPCKGCTDRYLACSDHCQKPEFIAWKEEWARIREARLLESSIQGYTANEIRKNRRRR